MPEKAGKIRSGELAERIRERIAESPRGRVRFRDFMEWCLYEPEVGYYMRGNPKLGKDGDFYTSSYIGTIMGEILARYLAKLARESGRPLQVVEWGAGDGRLASQILDMLSEHEKETYINTDYGIVEKSPYHRSRLQEALQLHRDRVRFLSADESDSYRADASVVVLSNELLDAFPVHRVRMREEGLQELYVCWNEEEGRFREAETTCGDPGILRYLVEGGITLLPGQTAEINLLAEAWIRERAERLAEGRILTIDYGDTAGELFAPHRMAGTLMCYKDHQAYDDPYVRIGEQDITSHVDFSACVRAGRQGGVREWKLYTQKEFLLENGIMDLLQNHVSPDPFGPAARRNRSIRQLLLTDQMSELFKVLEQIK